MGHYCVAGPVTTPLVYIPSHVVTTGNSVSVVNMSLMTSFSHRFTYSWHNFAGPYVHIITWGILESTWFMSPCGMATWRLLSSMSSMFCVVQCSNPISPLQLLHCYSESTKKWHRCNEYFADLYQLTFHTQDTEHWEYHMLWPHGDALHASIEHGFPSRLTAVADFTSISCTDGTNML